MTLTSPGDPASPTPPTSAPTSDLGDTMAPGAPRVSIVVPTRNEAESVGELLSRLAALYGSTSTEIVVVDDSTDRTPEVVSELARTYPLPVRLHHRVAGVGGLGGAVVEGIRLAAGEWIVVMDADLQHPPATVGELIETGDRTGADLVVASRYTPGGSRDGLSGPYRMLVSGVSTLAAKCAFPRRLRGIPDPMSGFFAIRRTAVDPPRLRPLGYKILLELVVRCRPRTVAVVPYRFGDRYAGESKSSVKEGLRFLRHLARLRAGGALEMVLFGLIGLSGFLPNLVVTWALASVAGVEYLVAAAVATEVAIAWNFLLVDLLLFRDRRNRPLLGRIGVFFAVSNLDLVIRLPLLAGLVELAHIGYLLGTVITLLAMFVLRFALTRRMVYPDRPTPGTWRVLDRWLRQAAPGSPAQTTETVMSQRRSDSPAHTPASAPETETVLEGR